jgi:hypothetical protein
MNSKNLFTFAYHELYFDVVLLLFVESVKVHRLVVEVIEVNGQQLQGSLF